MKAVKYYPSVFFYSYIVKTTIAFTRIWRIRIVQSQTKTLNLKNRGMSQVCSVVKQKTFQFKNNKSLKQHFNSKIHIDCLNVLHSQHNQRLVQRTLEPSTLDIEMANSSSALSNPSPSPANSPGMDIDYDGDAPDYSNDMMYFDFNQR